ncbi:adenosylcobinamide-GDP ribazoletransferase [Robertmurraya kyonggiensis]|uniref:Adenosylcobinamide-GDP ribazoletransferase n=1 Tax=Robertmurraya kyonggiensis TaxID=1037680 RepID=A0A4U1CXP0_9BACI|nr:adenosylcobinamide-GDP ribazoletransferase [Robertmurraya kyonggiensis]TKC14845.1 adenosylcobinamide-GDP ribazoletransferase [Robertmurraya kyonggiensis]
MKFLKGFLLNLQFFTSIPIRSALPMDKKHLQSSIKSFPLVGLLQGILYSGLAYVLIEWTPFSSVAIAFLLWLATIIITGGIHLDGWMDVSDAYFSYQDREKRLEIMKDPRIGAFGVLSVIVLLGSRFLFIYEIVGSMTFVSYIMMVFIPFLGKSVMGEVLVSIPAAKKEGLAAMYQEAGDRSSIVVYPIYLAIVAFFAQWIGLIIPYFILLVVALACYSFIRVKSIKWFNGITGDVVGASVEGTEIILWLTLWLLHYFVMV